MGLYTDLAAEARELHPELEGIKENKTEKDGISVSRIDVETEEAAKKVEKAIGRYVTIDAPGLCDPTEQLIEAVSERVAEELRDMIKDIGEQDLVLVVGLGNKNVTPDSLGPRCVDKVYVTRQITQYLPDLAKDTSMRAVAAIAPGVLGITGIETLELVKGVVEHLKPSLVIAIDALASRRAARISTTVQLANTGISPGAGVGNFREGMNAESLGVPVIAIGVPTVVYASTIMRDTIELISQETGVKKDERRLISLSEKVIEEHMGPLIVTPKEIDSIVDHMSDVVTTGINLALHSDNYENVKSYVS